LWKSRFSLIAKFAYDSFCFDYKWVSEISLIIKIKLILMGQIDHEDYVKMGDYVHGKSYA
jgi:hypothetical protein